MIPRQLLVTTAVLIALAIVMGLYLLRLQRRQNVVPDQPLAAQHVRPPQPSPATKTFAVWVAYDLDDTLRPQEIVVAQISGRQQQSEEILRGLLKIYVSAGSPHRLGIDSEVRSVYLADGGLAVIDVNSAFADEQTSGVLAEELTLASFAQSLVSNVSRVTQVKFLVDGKERETLAGHADLAATYNASEFDELTHEVGAK